MPSFNVLCIQYNKAVGGLLDGGCSFAMPFRLFVRNSPNRLVFPLIIAYIRKRQINANNLSN